MNNLENQEMLDAWQNADLKTKEEWYKNFIALPKCTYLDVDLDEENNEALFMTDPEMPSNDIDSLGEIDDINDL
jgi:hypothetical protein